MSTYLVKSTVITNRDATPKVLTDAYVSGGKVLVSQGYVQTASAADGIATKYILCQVPSSARIEAVKFASDQLGTSCTVDVGVWWPTFIPVGAGLSASVASTVIHTTLFASVLACSNTNALTDITNQSLAYTIALQETPLWNACGLASDPGIDLDIAVYVAAATQIQGYVGLKVSYVE